VCDVGELRYTESFKPVLMQSPWHAHVAAMAALESTGNDTSVVAPAVALLLNLATGNGTDPLTCTSLVARLLRADARRLANGPTPSRCQPCYPLEAR